MEFPDQWNKYSDSSVFELLTRLCEKTTAAYEVTEDFGSFNKTLTKKLRSYAYSILLKKSCVVLPSEPSEPVMDMLSDYFVKDCNKKNIADYDNLVSIRSKIDWLIDRDRTKDKPYFNESLACIVSLRNSVIVDHGKSMFENPFSFGKIDEILPSSKRLNPGDPKPYQHFPDHIFQLPFSINENDCFNINPPSLYSLPMDAFSSKPGTNLALLGKLSMSNVHSVSSRSSRGNQWSVSSSQCDEALLFFPRLTGPRDLIIPKDDGLEKKRKLEAMSSEQTFSLGGVSQFASSESIKYLPESSTPSMTSIWDLAQTEEPEITLELWQEASKLAPVQKRSLISSSNMQMSHWRLTNGHQLRRLNIISEVEFILHIKYLTMGIESSSFSYNKVAEKFQMKPELCLEGLLQSSLEIYVNDLLAIGTCYWNLNHLVTPTSTGENIIKEGFVYKSMCDSIRQYLVWFRLEVDKIFGEGLTMELRNDKPLPTLMEILHSLRPLSWQITTMAKIYKVYEHDYERTCLRGAGLMAYLYDEISLVTQAQVSALLYSTLKATCRVYFRFIQRFIFEGELEDQFSEFFIRKDPINVDSYNKRYWDKGFIIRNDEMVPEFLRGIAKYILLCGKSLRLLKLCNPDDPLCVLLSTEYPPIKCCLTFLEVEEQKKLYERYRVQCLYVCGEPVSFHSLLVQREAEKKAFREMVYLKQAETMHKLIEDRKRLSRVISDNKRRQFNALRTAAEDAASRREMAKKKDLQQDLLIIEYQTASNKLHDLRIEEEKQKLNAYYTEIGKEVERRQMKSQWKIKRLKLDERRVQLLTSEKISLTREKMELDHRSLEGNFSSILPNKSPRDSTMPAALSEVLINVEEASSVSEITQRSDDMAMKISSDSLHFDSQENLLDDSPENPRVEPISGSILEIKGSDQLDTFLLANNSWDDSDGLNNNRFLITDRDNNKISSTVRPEINKTTDAVDPISLSNIKVHKSDASPSDILNSNVPLKNVSFSDQNIHNTYQQQKQEFKRNKQRDLAHDFSVENYKQPAIRVIKSVDNSELTANTAENRSDAIHNKGKVLGSITFDSVSEPALNPNRVDEPQFDTEASREALRNRQKGSSHEAGPEMEVDSQSSKTKQRGSLTLDLKGCSKNYSWDWGNRTSSDSGSRLSIASTPQLMTPGQFPARLDVETPSTFDERLIGVPSATLSPISNRVDNIVNMSLLPFTGDGFRFPNIIEQQTDEEESVPDYASIKDHFPQTPESFKAFEDYYGARSSIWNFSSDELIFDNFKPFGIESTANNKFTSMNIFQEPLSMDNPKSPYTNFADIKAKAQKKPMTDTIFQQMFRLLEESENIVANIESADSSMMAACLQRSVVIPLSYQMEMVNNAILKYFLVTCDLYDHLKSLGDYFFLMDGEFAKTICSKLFEKLSTTESPRELLNFATLHSILDKSFGSSIGGSNKYAENLSFIVSDMPLSFKRQSPDVLESLTLSYTVAWPVNIIISREALDRYAIVFKFLVKLRWISWVLEQDLEVLKMSLKEEFMVSGDLLRSPEYHQVQIYRYSMSSFMRSIHCYVSTTCLQSSWSEFEQDLMKVGTLDDLYAVHVAYIKKVMYRCLLNKRSQPIIKMLDEIFKSVLQFHIHLNGRCWHMKENDAHYTHPFFDRMFLAFTTFDKQVRHLHKTVHRLHAVGYQKHLIELANMMNMNGFYDDK